MRTCRFCEVAVPNDAHVAAHLDGKKHRKLAGDATPSQCWVYREVEPAAEKEVAVAEVAPPASAPPVVVEEEGWQTVRTAQKRRAPKPPAAKPGKPAGKEDAPPAEARPLRVHRRCNDCGARSRDGAVIETDPDDERKAYCTACWDRYWYGEPAEEPTPEPRKHVTPWNRA